MPALSAAKVLTLEVDRSGRDPVVKLHGRLVAGTGDTLSAEVKPLFAGDKRVILDLTDLTHIDSMGLGTLARLYVSARSAGCDLALVNLGAQMRRLLGTTNLLSVFTIVGEHGIKIG